MAQPGPDDLPYLRTHFVALEELARAHGRDPDGVRAAAASGLLPAPAYVLADGTELVAPDHFALADAAGGEARLPGWFAEAYARAAAGEPAADPPEEAWRDYLSGQYAICLRSVTPETIVRKSVLIPRIEELLAAPDEGDPAWREALREAVDALDALERPFAPCDRVEGPVSRDRLITAVRERYPGAFPPASRRSAWTSPSGV
jgi:hypothetical protein